MFKNSLLRKNIAGISCQVLFDPCKSINNIPDLSIINEFEGVGIHYVRKDIYQRQCQQVLNVEIDHPGFSLLWDQRIIISIQNHNIFSFGIINNTVL